MPCLLPSLLLQIPHDLLSFSPQTPTPIVPPGRRFFLPEFTCPPPFSTNPGEPRQPRPLLSLSCFLTRPCACPNDPLRPSSAAFRHVHPQRVRRRRELLQPSSLASTGRSGARHHLHQLRRHAPHVVIPSSEPEDPANAVDVEHQATASPRLRFPARPGEHMAVFYIS